jgi:uncharacterized protein
MHFEAGVLLQRLEAVLRKHGPLAVAVSGGVDSMTLAVLACRLDPATQVFHALSPAVPELATRRVRHYAEQLGWALTCLDAGEMSDPDYRANPANRCYYCKRKLYTSLLRHTTLPLAAGTNLDDLQDYRPGLQAAREQQVVHPLVEAALTKRGVRQLAAQLGLRDLQELPASPCLSSRVTTGIAIEPALLPLIDRTEQALRQLLQRQGAEDDLRCRIRHSSIAIEAGPMHGALVEQVLATVRGVFVGTPFEHYSHDISIEPYRKGSAFIRVAT